MEVKITQSVPATLKGDIQAIKDRGERILAVTPDRWKYDRRKKEQTATSFIIVSQ